MYSGDPAKTSGHLVLTSNFGIKCFHTSSNDGLANKQRSFKMKYSIALRNAIDCFLNVHSFSKFGDLLLKAMKRFSHTHFTPRYSKRVGKMRLV